MKKVYLMAKFMGFEPIEFEARSKNGLEYNKSWDWLMPVIKEIEYKLISLDIEEENPQCYADMYNSLIDVNLDATFENAIKFIEWYELQIK